MKRITTLSALFIGIALMLLPTVAAADGLPGLTVEVLDPGDVLAGSDVTDACGYFSIGSLGAGDYRVIVTDPASPTTAIRPFTVPAEKDPAVLWGKVWEKDAEDVSLRLRGTIYGENEIETPVMTKVHVKQAWNRNWAKSPGWTSVRLSGTGLRDVTAVTLSSSEGTIAASRKWANRLGTRARAFFKKTVVFETLVPPTAGRGDTFTVTVSVMTPMGTQEFDRTIRIMGKLK